ncbi:hypothetical protein ZTR_05888 [Talaromyces verruculosus]|nr:hypothetical protein ZTR_05888 [Talaromyces verruculosus]
MDQIRMQVFEGQSSYSSSSSNNETKEQERKAMIGDGRSAIEAQLLILFLGASTDGQSKGNDWTSDNDFDNAVLNEKTQCPFTLRCRQEMDGKLVLQARFDENVILEKQACRFVEQIAHLVQQIQYATLEGGTMKLGDLNIASQLDLASIQKWCAAQNTEPVAQLVHDLIQGSVLTTPGAPALTSWDGELTYKELDDLSSQLAGHLARHGVCRGSIVPLLFEKSIWTMVGQLAVLKAGGVTLVLDANYPDQTIADVITQSESILGIASKGQAKRLRTHMPSVVEVSSRQSKNWERENTDGHTSGRDRLSLHPEDPAIILFTSGSTGKPKGILLSHRALVTTITHHASAASIHRNSRVLQFSSYAFDMSIYETYTALATGACICIPSETQRLNSICQFIRDCKVTWAFFTPSMLRNFEPEDLRGLITLGMGGENVPVDLASRWADELELLNIYGPAEATLMSTCRILKDSWIPGTFGSGVGCRTWIVQLSSADQLAPIGAIGELVIEGHLLASGYYNDPQKTSKAFIPPPKWRQLFSPAATTPVFFRTGDAVQYNPDGTIRYVGRDDAIVKIRGQRVDLEAVEHAIREIDPSLDVCVEAMKPPGAAQDEAKLTAFVTCTLAVADQASSATAESLFRNLQLSLSQKLPRYMVPTGFVPLTSLPLTRNKKLDRRQLQRLLVEQMSLNITSPALCSEEQPSEQLGEKEECLRLLTGEILKVDSRSIDMKKSFIEVGGDSMAAIRLTALARRKGLKIRAEELLQSSSTLLDIAQTIVDCSAALVLPPTEAAFAFFSDQKIRDSILSTAEQQYQIFRSDISDIYPCTPLQEGLMTTTTTCGSLVYQDQFVYKLHAGIDMERFHRAWTAVVSANPILRTRIIQISSGQTIQVVVVPKPTPFMEHKRKSLDSYLIDDQKEQMGFGTELVRFAYTEDANTLPCFVMTLHHSLYDAWSLSMIPNQIEAAYYGQSPERSSFSSFVRYVHSGASADALTFWTTHLSSADAAIFPELPSNTYNPRATAAVEHTTHSTASTHQRKYPFSDSIRIHLAWSIMLSLYTDSDDVIFGTVVSGRMASFPGIEKVFGPTVATVPFRSVLNFEASIRATLEQMQTQFTVMLPYEQTGVQNIARMNDDTKAACAFQNLLVVQPPAPSSTSIVSNVPSSSPSGLFSSTVEEKTGAINSFPGYGLILLCYPGPELVKFEALFDENLLDEKQVTRMMAQLSHIFDQLGSELDRTLRQIHLLAPSDQCQLIEWNNYMPPPTEMCIHEMISSQCGLRSKQRAICSWDGDFSYEELNSLSSAVAISLLKRGVKAGNITPILFEKSKWIAVAILAVMKTGAAFVLLDGNQGQQRHLDICHAVNAGLIITSTTYAKRLDGVVEQQTIYVIDDENTINTKAVTAAAVALDDAGGGLLSAVKPSHDDLAYAVFTSGSTGKPKGVLINHGSYCSSVLAHRDRFLITPATRVLQISSYAFDAFTVEILTVLCTGGCVCIPHETEMQRDLAQAIQRMDINLILITPAMLRLIHPDEVPDLQTVIAVGESMTPAQVALWSTKVNLICGYGPSECSTAASCLHIRPSSSYSNPKNIGYSMGCHFWVVHKNDHNVLVPIGTIGELLIQGPIVGSGYLNDMERTREAFFSTTTTVGWRTSYYPLPSQGRFYKTGDLVRYNVDGTCNYVGRKNQQTKLRGQRVEVGEVEQHVQQALGPGYHVVAAVIRPHGQDAKPLLVAFVHITRSGNSTIKTPKTAFCPVAGNSDFTKRATVADKILRRALPSIMVPSTYIQVEHIPLTPSKKINRRALEIGAAALTMPELFKLCSITSQEQEICALDKNDAMVWQVSDAISSFGSSKISDYQERFHGKDVPLPFLGLDSIELMALCRNLSRQFDVHLTVALLSDDSLTVARLARVIENCKEAARSSYHHQETNDPSFNLYEEFMASAALLPQPNRQKTGRVFLTGGTGYLGTEILRQLVQDPQIVSVTVLVRAESKEDALGRIKQSAETAEWWEANRHARKIVACPGDLSSTRLGLSQTDWDTLCQGTFDWIIHNGAAVHWTSSYRSLEAANVTSTIQFLQILAHPSCSFTGLTYLSALVPSVENKSDRQIAQELSSADGYTQSKFTSELLIKEFKKSYPNPISIIRPGLIMGSTANGICNVDDYLWRVVSASLRLGAYNAEESANSWLFISPVNRVASLVVEESLSFIYRSRNHHDPASSLHTIPILDGIPVPDFWKTIQLASSRKIKAWTSNQWLGAVKSDVDHAGTAHPIWPVIQFLEAANGYLGTAQSPSFNQPPAVSRSIESALQENIRYLTRIGFFRAPDSEHIDDCDIWASPKAVFRRTHNVALTSAKYHGTNR